MAFNFGVGGRVLLIIIHLFNVWIHHALAQDLTTDNAVIDPVSQLPQVSGKPDDHGFIDPIVINPSVEMFEHKGKEYLMVDIKVMHDFAEMMCPSYFSGTLATIPDLELAHLLSDSLAETNLEFESLWVGGKNSSDGKWNWIKNNYGEVISDDIINLIGNTNNSADLERHCLAFAREHHQVPQFKNLDCFVERPFMCERPRGSSGANDSTHGGWILIGNRYFKIFSEKVDYNTASINCFAADSTATLAVVDNMDDINQLGRYLLIGRPSLENAWIGARWIHDRYEFEADSSIILDNATDATVGFPPWRENAMQRPGGCLLLDRHITDTPLFVETRCHRLRPYICSKPAVNISTETDFVVITFDTRIYQVHYNPQPWALAQKICEDDQGKLVEPDSPSIVDELLYVMGQNITTMNHLWLGGRYVGDQWIWNSNQAPIDQSMFPFVQNNSYVEVIEQMNTCLNMDRENHIVALFYGTNCFYPQHFACMMAAAP